MADITSPPPGLNFTAAIYPSLTFILVMTPLGSMLVPVIILLFFFSTPSSRLTPVFVLNILACVLGLLEALLNDALEVKQILEPTETFPQALYIATIASTVLSPMIVDSVLLTRVIAFYPRNTSASVDRLKAIAFPMLVKCGRFIAVVLYLHSFTVASKNTKGSVLLVGELTWFKNRYIIAEWTLQIVDNTYSSLFFLYKLQLFDAYGRAGRIRGLFYIALGNFVFPIILNVTQIVLITTDRSFLDGTYVLVVNNYVSILGVVFATIWTTSSHWHRSNFGHSGSTWNQEGSDGSSTEYNLRGGPKNTHTVRLPGGRSRTLTTTLTPSLSRRTGYNRAMGPADSQNTTHEDIELGVALSGEDTGSKRSVDKPEKSIGGGSGCLTLA
ncbi:hypothetical protein M0805_008856 [Coniferiporia weirii]|nr:hypothetical protein M0805_008856 [Coniferiporia weirii]